MSAVVSRYVGTQTFAGSLDVQRQILMDYHEDVQKYAEGLDKTKIISVFNHLATQLAKDNKKFQYSLIAKGARSREYFGCVQWLLDCGGVIGKINRCEFIDFAQDILPMVWYNMPHESQEGTERVRPHCIGWIFH